MRRVQKHLLRCQTVPIHISILLYLLLLGDVELNPGPTYKYPCTRCETLRRNQKEIQCNSCDLWCHTKCTHMSDDAYYKLASSNDSWSCIKCTFVELSFSNYIPTNPESAKSVQHASAGEPEMNEEIDCDNLPSPLEDSTNQAIFCHLNVQSLMNKMDELCSVLTWASRSVVFGISETWLDHSISNGEVNIPHLHIIYPHHLGNYQIN